MKWKENLRCSSNVGLNKENDIYCEGGRKMTENTIQISYVGDALDLARSLLVNGYSVTISPNINRFRIISTEGYNVEYSKEDEE